MAKAYASDAYRKVAGAGIQLHGGIGYTCEHDLHLFQAHQGVKLVFGVAEKSIAAIRMPFAIGPSRGSRHHRRGAPGFPAKLAAVIDDRRQGARQRRARGWLAAVACCRNIVSAACFWVSERLA